MIINQKIFEIHTREQLFTKLTFVANLKQVSTWKNKASVLLVHLIETEKNLQTL